MRRLLFQIALPAAQSSELESESIDLDSEATLLMVHSEILDLTHRDLGPMPEILQTPEEYERRRKEEREEEKREKEKQAEERRKKEREEKERKSKKSKSKEESE